MFVPIIMYGLGLFFVGVPTPGSRTTRLYKVSWSDLVQLLSYEVKEEDEEFGKLAFII